MTGVISMLIFRIFEKYSRFVTNLFYFPGNNFPIFTIFITVVQNFSL